MRKTVAIALLALLFFGCSKEEAAQSVAAADAKPTWEEFAAKTVSEYYAKNPETAVDAGLHEYDGQMSDKSMAGRAAKAEWIDQVIDGASAYTDLIGIEAFERDYLLTEMRGQLFWLRDSGYATKKSSRLREFWCQRLRRQRIRSAGRADAGLHSLYRAGSRCVADDA